MSNTRFVKSVTETANSCETVLPWTRGRRRAAFIAKRRAALATETGTLRLA